MISTNIATVVTAGVIAFVALSDFGSRQYERVFKDNTTPLVKTLTAMPATETAVSGDTFDVHYKYFRRPGCVGTVEYRLDGRPSGWNHDNSFVIARYSAKWPDGQGEQAAHVPIPEHIPPGEYEFTFITRADTCEAKDGFKASTKPIEGRSLPVKITIKEKL